MGDALRRLLIAPALALTVIGALGVPIAAAASGSSSSVCVEVVIDYGALNDNRTSATCVVVPKGSTGAAVLDARAKKLGVAQPRYRSDGLLCAIDGLPKGSECAERTSDGGYRYWSYWHKQDDGSWTYAQSGPFDYTVTGSHPGEGWSWVEGHEQNSRPPARVSYARVCPADPSPADPSPAAQPPAASTHHGASGTTSSGARRAATGTPQASAGAPSPPGPGTSTNPAAATGSPAAEAPGQSASPAASEVAIAEPARQDGDGGTPLPGLLAGVAIVSTLGAAAWWRAKRAAQP